jgi:rhodanese-related sulfurtransferase
VVSAAGAWVGAIEEARQKRRATMSEAIDNERMRALMEQEDAQVIDVLPSASFEKEHIRGARSIPLKEINEQGVQALDRSRPVIVYCNDFL